MSPKSRPLVSGMGPGSGAGATVEVTPTSVPVSDRWYEALETSSL